MTRFMTRNDAVLNRVIRGWFWGRGRPVAPMTWLIVQIVKERPAVKAGPVDGNEQGQWERTELAPAGDERCILYTRIYFCQDQFPRILDPVGAILMRNKFGIISDADRSHLDSIFNSPAPVPRLRVGLVMRVRDGAMDFRQFGLLALARSGYNAWFSCRGMRAESAGGTQCSRPRIANRPWKRSN